MSTPHQSPLDTHALSSGPFLHGSVEPVDGDLVRLTLDARPSRLARLRARWHATRLRRIATLTRPAGDVALGDELVSTLGPIRTESARRLRPT